MVIRAITCELNEGDRILRKASLESFGRIKEKNKQYENWQISTFVKGNIEELRKIMQELDVYEKAFLYSITPYIV